MKHLLKKCSDHKCKLRLLKKKLNQEIHENMSKTTEVQLMLQRQQRSLKEENNTFLNSYSLATSYIKNTDPFSNLKSEYSQRGYKVPNLSIENNIFRPNPLLAGNEREIQMYYNINTTVKDYEHKPRNFLNKVHKKLNERIANTGKKGFNGGIKLLLDDTIPNELRRYDYRTTKMTLSENIAIEEYNKTIERLINDQFSQGSPRKKTVLKGNTMTVSKFYSQQQLKRKTKPIVKPLDKPLLSPQADSNHPVEENAHTDTSRTDITRSVVNSGERYSMSNRNLKLKPQLNSYTHSHEGTKVKLKHSNTHMDTIPFTLRPSSKKGKNNDQLKAKEQSTSLFNYNIFESKQKFLEYLREIEIDHLNQETFSFIVKEYLRRVKDWKEDTIKQFLIGETVLDEIQRLVFDFNSKISMYDIVGSIPDKSKTVYSNRVIQIDSIARKLPKHIIQRMIRSSKLQS